MKRCEHYDFDCKEETCGCEGCGFREKSADEMFEQLDFEKDTLYENIISYEDDKMKIEFWTDMEFITCDGNMTKDIIAAMIKKVEELGWN